MSVTVINEERQTTLPADVFAAAGLKGSDQVDWRYEGGEIRGRKLPPTVEPRVVMARLVRKEGELVFEVPGVEVDPEAIATAVAEERQNR